MFLWAPGWLIRIPSRPNPESKEEKSLNHPCSFTKLVLSLTECNTRNVDGSEILHLSIGSLSHDLHGFVTSQVQDSSINSMVKQFCGFIFWYPNLWTIAGGGFRSSSQNSWKKCWAIQGGKVLRGPYKVTNAEYPLKTWCLEDDFPFVMVPL